MLVAGGLAMIHYLVVAAIPDDKVLHAEEIAEGLCKMSGGKCDWEFDSDRVRYWFTNAGAWSAFKAHCTLMGWRIGKKAH
jgi:hypothetical protein